MGWFSSLFADDDAAAKEVVSALRSFAHEPTVSEGKFRDQLLAHVARLLRVTEAKAEAGLLGEGTKIDLMFNHGGEDFFVTIKKGLSEQKAKILLGELLLIIVNLAFNEHPRKAHIVLLVMRNDSMRAAALTGHQQALMNGVTCLNGLVLGALSQAHPDPHGLREACGV